jgi:flagellar basal-body rod protein FlgF
MGVTAENGELAFTRRGDLRVNTSGALENGLGQLIRNEEGGNVTIPAGFMARIADDGTVFANDPSQPGVPQQVPVGRLLLRDASQTPLRRREDGLFKADGQPSGTDFASGTEPVSLTVRALEGSNVNPMEAMVKMIEHSRAFEQQVKIIKNSTENDQAGAAMMKLA